jgi:serine/threonine protein phosphatase 1
MLSRLLARTPVSPPSVGEDRVVYAVGDVHGRADLLMRLHAMIQEDAAAAPPVRRVLVYLGDYVDRGPASREVIDLLLDGPPRGFEAVHLLGNHEHALLSFLEDISVAPMWFTYGGLATMHSYGLQPMPGDMENPQRLRQLQRQLADALPPNHLAFLRGLALHHSEGDYLFVHAGLRPGKPLEEQKAWDLISIRDDFLRSRADHGQMVVHGHSIAEKPQVARNRIGIDTGAYATGRLTCLRLHDTSRRFLST